MGCQGKVCPECGWSYWVLSKGRGGMRCEHCSAIMPKTVVDGTKERVDNYRVVISEPFVRSCPSCGARFSDMASFQDHSFFCKRPELTAKQEQAFRMSIGNRGRNASRA